MNFDWSLDNVDSYVYEVSFLDGFPSEIYDDKLFKNESDAWKYAEKVIYKSDEDLDRDEYLRLRLLCLRRMAHELRGSFGVEITARPLFKNFI